MERSAGVISRSRMSAVEKPLSTKTDESSRKTIAMATRPKSSGNSSRASSTVITKLAALAPSLSNATQSRPTIERSISDGAAIPLPVP